MGFNDINLQVSGPVQPASIYKTKVLKGQVPFATQVTEPNTKYVIKHNFVLDGKITIPVNCVLEFDGGSIYKTSGDDSTVNILYQNTLLTGNINLKVAAAEESHIANKEICIDWFGLSEDPGRGNRTNSRYNWSVAFKHLLDYGGILYFTPNKKYYLEERSIPSAGVAVDTPNRYCEIRGNGATIMFDAPLNTANYIWLSGGVNLNGKANTTIKVTGLNIDGSLNWGGYHPTSGNNQVQALRLEGFKNILVEHCSVKDFYGSGFVLKGSSTDIANIEVRDNLLINVGYCYGENGGQAISVSKCNPIVVNNYIHNEYLDGAVSADGNIHRRNWIGIQSGENMSRETIIENNDIYGYDRAIHLEIVTHSRPNTIRNNHIAGCDIGIVLWNITSDVDIEHNIYYNTDLESEHGYINSSISNASYGKAVYVVGPCKPTKLHIEKNYIKADNGYNPLMFIDVQSPNAIISIGTESGYAELTDIGKNMFVRDNKLKDKTNVAVSLFNSSFGIECFDNNSINAPKATVVLGIRYDGQQISSNKISAKEVSFYHYQYTIVFTETIISNIVGNRVIADTVKLSVGNAILYKDNILNNASLIFNSGHRRNLVIDENGYPMCKFDNNKFVKCAFNEASSSIAELSIKGFNYFVSYDSNGIPSKSYENKMPALQFQRKEDGTVFIAGRYQAYLDNGGTRPDEQYIGAIRGYFKKGSLVRIYNGNKLYRFTSDGWYALTGWYASASYPKNEVINNNDYIYQNITNYNIGKSGSTSPTFSGTSVSDNQITWNRLTSADMGVTAVWEANTDYEKDSLIIANGYTWQATMKDKLTGSTIPTFPTTTGQTVTDGAVTWVCRGAKITYEEVV